MKMTGQNKILAVAAISAIAVGIGVGASVPTRMTSAPGADPQLASMLNARSPGMRSAAAVSTKAPAVQKVAFTPTLAPPSSDVMAERTPVVKIASAAPPVAILPAIAPAVLAPVPATALAAAFPAVAIATPAAIGGGSSLIGAAAVLPFIPAVIGGGGGGGGGIEINLAPAVPEPATWLMMIAGFGVLGFALRRRRRQARGGALGEIAPLRAR